MRSSPSLAAVIATLIATSESPPSSKKLAFRSTERRPGTAPRYAATSLPSATVPFLAAGGLSCPGRRRSRRPVGRGGVGHPPAAPVLDPMPLTLKGIAGKGDQLRRCAARSGAQSTSTPADQSWPSASRKHRGRHGSGRDGASTEPLGDRLTTWGAASPTRSTCRRGHLYHDAMRVGKQHIDFVGEPHRRPHLARPCGRVGRFAGGQPGASDVGQQRNLGSRSVCRDRNPVNSGIIESINREWNACEVRTRRATIPFSLRRSLN